MRIPTSLGGARASSMPSMIKDTNRRNETWEYAFFRSIAMNQSWWRTHANNCVSALRLVATHHLSSLWSREVTLSLSWLVKTGSTAATLVKLVSELNRVVESDWSIEPAQGVGSTSSAHKKTFHSYPQITLSAAALCMIAEGPGLGATEVTSCFRKAGKFWPQRSHGHTLAMRECTIHKRCSSMGMAQTAVAIVTLSRNAQAKKHL